MFFAGPDFLRGMKPNEILMVSLWAASSRAAMDVEHLFDLILYRPELDLKRGLIDSLATLSDVTEKLQAMTKLSRQWDIDQNHVLIGFYFQTSESTKEINKSLFV